NTIDDEQGELIPVFRAGVNYKLREATWLRASYGQGYRFPAIAERFIKTLVGGIAIYPNDSLNAEKGYSTEAGISQGFRVAGFKGILDVAGFLTRYREMVEFTFGLWGGPTDPFIGLGFKALNSGDTRISGIDISLSGTGNIGAFGLTIMAGYTYMDPVQESFNPDYVKKVSLPYDSLIYLGSDSSNFLKYRFHHMMKADVEISYKKFAIGAGARYTSF